MMYFCYRPSNLSKVKKTQFRKLCMIGSSKKRSLEEKVLVEPVWDNNWDFVIAVNVFIPGTKAPKNIVFNEQTQISMINWYSIFKGVSGFSTWVEEIAHDDKIKAMIKRIETAAENLGSTRSVILLTDSGSISKYESAKEELAKAKKALTDEICWYKS
ncbi:hypothetical protein AVV36_gp208 [Pectobacterium bacteriophage PM2]|uniref:Uncharacterized protein n=1 Tax=Pectobacterium bacteriophage PM2 TaxID=1429794 RepID=A0A0A0Q3L5_9CAUD|nr:hypothetical protein AVV36_gp208 [Pectobacterium bacteriophage PM2]AHY25202.1 hypothetical protein PM2_240 [Pectobacterium bacteriophage PM2]